MQSSCSYKAVLIGNGTMGQRHKRLFEEDGVEFVGIADTTAEADALFKKIVAGDISPDFAVVASPAVAHDEYVKKCIEIKLPLLVEKPVSISALAAMEYQKLALEQNAFVFVGHSERYNPAIEEFTKTDFFKEMQDYLCQLYQVHPNERIFPVTKYYLNHEMVRGCKASGVKKIRVHDIRHSHVSLLINMGFSALAIGERVGHEAEKITYRYAHLFPTVQTEMADRLNDARVLDTKEENSKGGKDDVEEKAG